MTDSADTFSRFREQYDRLHDPSVRRTSLELVPVPMTINENKPRTKVNPTRQSERLSASAEPRSELLPIALLEKLALRGQPLRKAKAGKTNTPSTKNALRTPIIRFEPSAISHCVNLFQEERFTLDAPGAARVEAVWRREQESTLQRAPVDHIKAAHFEARISLPDGRYLFGYDIDGYMRPDIGLAQNIILGADGIFSPFELLRGRRQIRLTNHERSTVRVLIEGDSPWIILDATVLDLPPGESTSTYISFDLNAMKEGLNTGLLRVNVQQGDQEIPAGIIQVRVTINVGGSVPEFSVSPSDLGQLRQGIDRAQLRVEVMAKGTGRLTGVISLAGELVDFRLDAEESSNFAYTFNIDSAFLPKPGPHNSEAKLDLMILTDSFLANRRLCRAEIVYRLLYLRKSLPALSFGRMRAGVTKSLRLDVKCSDNREIELTVALPTDADKYLEAYQARPNAYVFRFDAQELPPGTNVNETVQLIDRKSGLRDHIKVLATISDEVETLRVAAP